VDIFHHHLESVEAPCLRHLNFCAEALGQIFEHNTITGCKKGKHMLNEVLLISRKLLPVLRILAEVNFVNGPEASHLILVHLPDVFVNDGQDDEAIRVFLKQRFW
jgi:hypothetical protein